MFVNKSLARRSHLSRRQRVWRSWLRPDNCPRTCQAPSHMQDSTLQFMIRWRPNSDVPIQQGPREAVSLMVLTVHELTAASSAVAFLAIVGGYLGVRSANRNAVKIAREERSSRRQDELDALRRATYARFLAALTALAVAALEQEAISASPQIRGEPRIVFIKRRTDALVAARNIAAELDLLAPDLLRRLANESLRIAGTCNRKNEPAFALEVAKLRVAMRYDLEGPKIPNLKELDRIAHSAIAAPSPAAEGEKSAVMPSVSGGTEASDISNSSA